MTATQQSTRALGMRIAAFYGALFVVYGMHVPYMPVWLDGQGLSASQVSAVLAAPFFLRLFVTPTIAVAADRSGAHRGVLIALAWMSLAVCLLLSQAAPFWPIFVLATALVICNSTIMPLAETIAVSGMRTSGIDYGRIRLWGSLTFVAASFAGGAAIDRFGPAAGVWLVAIGCALTIFAAHALPRVGEASSRPRPATPIWQAPELLELLRQPAFRSFLIAAGGAQAAHATFLGFGALIWQGQGLSGVWIGSLWAIGVFVEVAVFAVSGSLIARFGPAKLLIAAAAASILRWAAMAFEPSLSLLIPLQMLHGATYGASHIAAIHFIHAAVPAHVTGVGQAMYATVAAGLAMGGATLAAGWLYAPGGAAAYAAMVIVSLLALGAALRLRRIWTGAPLLAKSNDGPKEEQPKTLAPEPLIGG